MDRFVRAIYATLFIGVHLTLIAAPFVLWDSGVNPWLIGSYNAIVLGFCVAGAVYCDIDEIIAIAVWYARKTSLDTLTGVILTLGSTAAVIIFFVSDMTWLDVVKCGVLPGVLGLIFLGITLVKFRARLRETEARTSSEIE